MKLASSWIKECLRRTMLSDTEVAQAMEQAGIEVEQVISSTKIDERVVVALVKKVVQHPGADRLKLVEVTTGDGLYHIVCGAPNVREGLKVAFAQIGSVLPEGDRIEKAKLRGEVSEGMLCSERELKLGNDHNGILELSNDAEVGTPLCDIYPPDAIIDIKTPANRFDVLSVFGLAREVAAMTTAELTPLSPAVIKASSSGPAVAEGALAARYMLARMAVKAIGSSPPQMVARLRAAGMRSVSPVVDITNYAMLEVGQPLHAFDAAKVALPIEVRMAKAGEQLKTLDGVNRKLTEADLIIADQHGPLALAGLMGGADSEIGADTTDILLESAVFDAPTVRKMAKRHGLRTEASARFERALPVELPPLGLDRAVRLLSEMADGQLIAVTDQQNADERHHRIEFSLSWLRSFIGFGITTKQAHDSLNKLGIITTSPAVKSTRKSEDLDELIIVERTPWWRPDLERREDLAEEIVRVLGYDWVPSTIPAWRPRQMEFDSLRARRRRARDLLYAAGLFEVITYSFVAAEQLELWGLQVDEHLKLKNPLSSEQAYLRSTMLPSFATVLAKNRAYAKQIGFYEISGVFEKRSPGDQPLEPVHLAVLVNQPEAAYHHLKGILDRLAWELHLELAIKPKELTGYAPGRAGEVWLGDECIGVIGQLHPAPLQNLKIEGEAAYLELGLEALITCASPRAFAGVERFPTIVRDMNVLIPIEVTWQSVRETLVAWRVEFVGDYQGDDIAPGYKSMTLRLTTVNNDHTPTEAEALRTEQAVLTLLERTFKARQR